MKCDLSKVLLIDDVELTDSERHEISLLLSESDEAQAILSEWRKGTEYISTWRDPQHSDVFVQKVMRGVSQEIERRVKTSRVLDFLRLDWLASGGLCSSALLAYLLIVPSNLEYALFSDSENYSPYSDWSSSLPEDEPLGNIATLFLEDDDAVNAESDLLLREVGL